jgi:protease YdgD
LAYNWCWILLVALASGGGAVVASPFESDTSCGVGPWRNCATNLTQPLPMQIAAAGIVGLTGQRVQVRNDQWPWSSIGRVNVVFGTGQRGFCTGTLIGPRQVVTAAHCLFNTRVNDWAKPDAVHFVIGQPDERSFAHSTVDTFEKSPLFRLNIGGHPMTGAVADDIVRHDWAILTLHDALNLKPVRIQAFRNTALPRSGVTEEIALAGYAQDHQYVLSVHNGCSATVDSPESGTIMHSCEMRPGESGGPILLLHDGKVQIIGIVSGSVQRLVPRIGLQIMFGRGASASAFEEAAARAVPP